MAHMHQDGIGTGSSMVAPKQQSDPKKGQFLNQQWSPLILSPDASLLSPCTGRPDPVPVAETRPVSEEWDGGANTLWDHPPSV